MFGNERPRPGSVELQDEIMRFEGRFASRLATAFGPLIDSSDSSVHLRAARDELAYLSAALDIAVGSSPEVDLLDMVTLVTLGSSAVALRWSEAAYGEAGRRVARAFDASLMDISEVARRGVGDEVAAQLRVVIGEWQAENPGVEDVASVRLSAYAYDAGEEGRGGITTRFAKDASGLFSLVRGAARTADTAVLLGERALYATQRLPFLLRAHARIVGNDLFAEGDRTLARIEGLGTRLFVPAFIFCAGVAVVTASSWLVARLIHHRLTSA
jgi:hypothetical protein